MAKIKIEFKPSHEMMYITDETGKWFFNGNYWDFDRSPDALKNFLESLGLEVEIIELDDDDE